MVSESSSKIDKVLGIVAEELGVTNVDLAEATAFTELGLDDLLAKSILSRIQHELQLQLPKNVFHTYDNASSLARFLATEVQESVTKHSSQVKVQAQPLSLILQGQIKSSKKTLFLLPDGSGSGMAYAMLPKIDPDICLVAMNSPYLHNKGHQFTVESIAAIWAEEIRRRQPNGPYFIGGWSAGGYYSFELAKHLMLKGLQVEKVIMIDTPCRLDYEELPMEVVHFLAKNNLMGNWAAKGPPQWMVDHFEMSIQAMKEYSPTAMENTDAPDVSIIWAQDGVLKNAGQIASDVDFSVKVTNLMLHRPINYGLLGWDNLFPSANIAVANMPGNHFTIVFPPNATHLSDLLRDALQSRMSERRCSWDDF